MRRSPFGWTLAAVTLLSGCNSTKMNLFRGREEVQAPATAPDAAALVNYLNDNADRVQSVRCDSLDLQCSQGIRSIGLRGRMVCQKPRNFRMSAEVFGKPEMDIGSNDEEFWFWIPRGLPYQIHCSHTALAEGKVQRMPFPVQPDWLVEAMGLARYGPADRYQVVAKARTVELIEKAKSPTGKAILKVTEFQRGRADLARGYPQVTAHRILDAQTGQEICSAQIVQVRVDRSGAVLPRKVVLYCPPEKLKLSMTLDDVTVNGQVGRPELLFRRRPLTNVRSYDLALGRFDDSNPIQPVEGRR
jgi:hypothetical protein